MEEQKFTSESGFNSEVGWWQVTKPLANEWCSVSPVLWYKVPPCNCIVCRLNRFGKHLLTKLRGIT